MRGVFASGTGWRTALALMGVASGAMICTVRFIRWRGEPLGRGSAAWLFFAFMAAFGSFLFGLYRARKSRLMRVRRD